VKNGSISDDAIPCDYLIEAGWIIPIRPAGVVLRDHAVIVTGDVITAILPAVEAIQRYRPDEHIKKPDAVLMPGLVNAHCHNPMTLMRGVADDLALMPWLNQHIWPIERAVMAPEYIIDGIELAVAEMIRGGSTCCNENYFFPDAIAIAYQRAGFRAAIGIPVIDFPSAWATSRDEYFDKGLAVHDTYRSNPLLSFSMAPHAPYTVNDAGFERIRRYSEQLDLPVHCHLHETRQEIADSMEQYGQRPFARLDRLGLVNEHLTAVHMTQMTPAEIALCAERGVSVVHCPQSNLKLASGFCPSAALLAAGVNVAIGTDGCASNNDLDMFEELRTAALLAKAVAEDATAFKAFSALEAATLSGARAMGLENVIGSLQPGKQADLIIIDLARIEAMPLYDVISQLVYAGARHWVSDVWIAGRVKLRDYALKDMDIDRISANAKRWQKSITQVPRL
jgi:5-methylthioadenosine/S-adenosylhomocysteine deaminase